MPSSVFLSYTNNVITYDSQPDGSTVVENINLMDGCYDFVIFDSYGDGICCSWGTGSYELTDGSTILASGGAFGSSETTNFCLGGTGSTSYFVSSESEGTPVTVDIYPNPVRNGVVHVVSTRDDMTFRVLNISGQTLKNGNLQDNRIFVGDLKPGIYLIELTSVYKSLKKKIVIE